MSRDQYGQSLNIAPQSVSDEGDSEDYSETDELIERILENYEFKFKPEIRFKIKHKLPDLALCACYSKPWQATPKWRFTMKPIRTGGPVSRYVRSLLVVPDSGQAALFSSKINFSVFRLQFVLAYNWKQNTPSLDYRLTTKWGDGPRLKRKERVQVSDAFLLRAKWNMEAHFPDLEGHLGGSGNSNTAVDVDYGGVSFEISQLDAVLDLSSGSTGRAAALDSQQIVKPEASEASSCCDKGQTSALQHTPGHTAKPANHSFGCRFFQRAFDSLKACNPLALLNS